MPENSLDKDNIKIAEETPASAGPSEELTEPRRAEASDKAAAAPAEKPEAPSEEKPADPESEDGEASEEKREGRKRSHIILPSDKISLLLAVMLAVSMLLGTSASMVLWSSYWETQTVHPAINPGPFDNRIIPGFRAGFITIGMNSAFLEPNLGTCAMRPQKDGLICIFQDRLINVSVTNNRVASVFTTNPHFVITLQNDANQDQTDYIHVGSDIDLVLRTFGSNYDSSQSSSVDNKDVNNEKYVLHYWAQGIHFGAYKHKVTYIMITESILEDSDLVVRSYPQPLHGQ